MTIASGNLRRSQWIARLLTPPIVAGVALAGLYVNSMFREPPGWSLTLLLVVVVQVYVIAEGVRWISRLLQRWLPWRSHLGTRALVQVLASALFACAYLLLIYVPIKLYQIAQGADDSLAWPHLLLISLVALAFGLALGMLQLIFDVLAQWQRSALEAEQLRRNVLRAELDALKAQINPHFLFNSLNTLHGLIDQQPERAQSLVLELADVFRYVLRHGEHDLVPLADELSFVEAYLRILNARHGSAFHCEIQAGEATERVALPPLSLQLLVENAVRHNQMDASSPLRLQIIRQGDSLQISNPRRARRGNSSGSGHGLHNLITRYQLLGAPAPQIEQSDKEFAIRLPLLPCPS